MNHFYRSIICVLIVVCYASAQNLVTNGDFESGMSGWGPWFVDENASWAEPPTAEAEFYTDTPGLGESEKAMYVNVYQPGKDDWYILVSKDVPMEQDKMYELSFRAVSFTDRTISVGVFEDISSGSPFFTEIVEINDQDIVHGPFPFLYQPDPKQPGLKFQFGGFEGDVILDDVVIVEKETTSDYTPYNSLADIIDDVTLPHEGIPHGVPESYDWQKAPRRGAQKPPEGWTAAMAWGQLYEWAEGNPAENTRVQIRDMEMLYLSSTDGMWHELQKSLLVEGAAYVEDFVDDISRPADKRTEPDGSISVTAGEGYNFHFWPATGRAEIPANEIEGCFITVQCRLILDDPDGVDDREDAGYLMSVGGDWWLSMDAQWDQWTTNYDMGIGRFRFITPEWKGYNMISLPVDMVEDNPPPFVGNQDGVEAFKPKLQNFELEQNYPNPFNPETTIQYTLNKTDHVQLNIIDVRGRVVETLVNGNRPAGTHHISFNAKNIPSGVYFYELESGENRLTKKMTLLK